MPFGGAGPLHAAALAERLGISRVLCPRASGVLSAVGLAAAPPRRDVARTLLIEVGERSEELLEQARSELLEQALAELGESPARVRLRHELRYRGQSFELPVQEERIPPRRNRDSSRPRCGGLRRRTSGPLRIPRMMMRRSSWSICASRSGRHRRS